MSNLILTKFGSIFKADTDVLLEMEVDYTFYQHCTIFYIELPGLVIIYKMAKRNGERRKELTHYTDCLPPQYFKYLAWIIKLLICYFPKWQFWLVALKLK